MTPEVPWRPTAGCQALQLRATTLAAVREFFAARQVLEVHTPVLGASGLADAHVDCFRVPVADGEYYLQSSPEYPMKRLLAAGSGDIYQLCPVFRAGERGRLHNPEFLMLEWYRLGLDHHGLMDEVEALLVHLRPGCPPARRIAYRDAFAAALGFDPLLAPTARLLQAARELGAPPSGLATAARDAWLDWLMCRAVAPGFASDRPTLVFDYPASQCALARIDPGPPATARRFELYWGELELANGYHELSDPQEQAERFARERRRRLADGAAAPAADARLLAALAAGLPDCAGVALGFDRLLMVLGGAERIDEVLSFPWERA